MVCTNYVLIITIDLLKHKILLSLHSTQANFWSFIIQHAYIYHTLNRGGYSRGQGFLLQSPTVMKQLSNQFSGLRHSLSV